MIARYIGVMALSLLVLLFPGPGMAAEMLSVVRDGVELRSGPGENNPVQWKYDKGFPVEVLGEKGEWLRVADFEGDSGWVRRSALDKKPHMVVRVNKNQAIKVNLRSGPGEEHAVVGEAVYGVVFATEQQKLGWVKVRHASGLEGWIKRNLLWGF